MSHPFFDDPARQWTFRITRNYPPLSLVPGDVFAYARRLEALDLVEVAYCDADDTAEGFDLVQIPADFGVLEPLNPQAVPPMPVPDPSSAAAWALALDVPQPQVKEKTADE